MAPFSPELLAAPRTDRYNIISLLGRGATSLVYKAFDVDKKLTVALKSLRFQEPDEIYRIKQEFRFFRDFYHPNLVMFYDLFVDDATCFYTMELIEGVDFVSFVGSNERMLRACFGQLIEAIAAVHEAGRLHRDLKPSNILVEPSERTVLLDFGLATEARSSSSIMTQAQLYGGTPAYMAPEQMRGEPASQASDMYALGVILYPGADGSPALPRRLPGSPRHEAQKSPPAPPSRLNSEASADLGDLALRLLSFDPRERPLVAELKRLAQTRGPARTKATGNRFSTDCISPSWAGTPNLRGSKTPGSKFSPGSASRCTSRACRASARPL